MNKLEMGYKIIGDTVLWDCDAIAEDAKPCPFCGNRTIITRSREFIEKTGLHGLSYECKKCDMNKWYFPKMSDDSEHRNISYDELYVEALNEWNTRMEDDTK